MRYLLTRWPWIAPVAQYTSMAFLAGLVIATMSSAQYFQMAFDSFLLGMLFWGCLMGHVMERRMKEINALMERMIKAESDAISAAMKFDEAVKNGGMVRFEPDEAKPPTKH